MADDLGIDRVFAGVRPEDKAAKVGELQREGLKVAEKLAREQAHQGAELEEIRQWQESVARFANANQESGNRRRARKNSS